MSSTQEPMTQGFELNLSDRAAEEVRKFFETEQVPAETSGLRVSVMPGGCSGFKYSLNIEEQAAEDDMVMSVNGGSQTVPTVKFADGSTLTNPSAGDVKARLA